MDLRTSSRNHVQTKFLGVESRGVKRTMKLTKKGREMNLPPTMEQPNGPAYDILAAELGSDIEPAAGVESNPDLPRTGGEPPEARVSQDPMPVRRDSPIILMDSPILYRYSNSRMNPNAGGQVSLPPVPEAPSTFGAESEARVSQDPMPGPSSTATSATGSSAPPACPICLDSLEEIRSSGNCSE